jgi:dTDP-D-glucose 4,6-dehydratase
MIIVVVGGVCFIGLVVIYHIIANINYRFINVDKRVYIENR